MSKVYKCDFCGKVVDKKMPIGMIKFKRTCIVDVGGMFAYIPSKRMRIIHMCEDCEVDIQDLMKQNRLDREGKENGTDG